MAPRKTPTRRKRPSRGKKSGHSMTSVTSVFTVGVIIAAGATALWASTQNKSPSASVSQLLSPLIASTGFGTDTRSSSQRVAANPTRSAPQSNPARNNTSTSARITSEPVAVARPQIPLNNAQPANKPASSVAALQPAPQRSAPPHIQTQVQARPASTAAPQKPASTAVAVPVTAPKQLPENGNSRHASGAYKVPKVIYARQALSIREKAWDQAKLMGNVEKGREMRSYAKVGRWHRVVVPSTNIIGWVLEDQLIIKDVPRQLSRQHNRQPSNTQKSAAKPDPLLTTGSVKRVAPVPAAPKKSTATVKPSYTKPLYPSQPLGKH